MHKGVYCYCILDGEAEGDLGVSGIGGFPVFAISFKDISAVSSNIELKKREPEIDEIIVHHKVVDEVRSRGTVIPLRFGAVFRARDGVEKLLKASYSEFKSKIEKFRRKNEFGLKIILAEKSLQNFEQLVQNQSTEFKRISKEIATSGQGTAYFLQLRLNDYVKNEALRRIEEVSGEVHRELSACAEEARLIKTELDQVILNATYLVEEDKVSKFNQKSGMLKQRYEPKGLIFHASGPWPPYSFC